MGAGIDEHRLKVFGELGAFLLAVLDDIISQIQECQLPAAFSCKIHEKYLILNVSFNKINKENSQSDYQFLTFKLFWVWVAVWVLIGIFSLHHAHLLYLLHKNEEKYTVSRNKTGFTSISILSHPCKLTIYKVLGQGCQT